MVEDNICPGCGRHCNLSAPHCERGEEYLHTGKLSERKYDDHHVNRMMHYQESGMNDKLIINLLDISRMMHKQYEGKASQKRVLIILNESDHLTQKELTERLGIQPGSASEILSKLENAGLITRTQSEADRRTTDIRLTESGAILAADAAEKRLRRHEEMFLCLTAEEQETLLSLLEKIHTDWEKRYAGPYDYHGHHGEYGGHDHPGEHVHRDGKHHGIHSHHGE